MILHQKCEKYTFSNYLGAKTSTEQKKWVHVVISKIGSQNPPWAHRKHRNTKKWPQEGQNWHQCTSCGPTNWFWANKKNKFESVRSKVCSFHTESAPWPSSDNFFPVLSHHDKIKPPHTPVSCGKFYKLLLKVT